MTEQKNVKTAQVEVKIEKFDNFLNNSNKNKVYAAIRHKNS